MNTLSIAISQEKVSVKQGRLASLDALRGFDMFLLVFFQPVLVSVGEAANVSWLNDILYQFDHEVWEGFRFWDIIMPLFMFMCGVSMPFSFAKYEGAEPKSKLYLHIIKRVTILWIIGMVVQGNLLAFDHHSLRLYSNTLQAIAAGYLIGALIILNLSMKLRIFATFMLLLIYWVPMTFWGDFTPEGNFAEHLDRALLGRWRDGVYWESNQWYFYSPYTYTWIWSSLTFGVTVMLGYFAGSLIQNFGRTQRTVTYLIGIGIGLILISLVWHLQMPIIKRLWTCSMTLFAGGSCFLLMALFFWWIDVKGNNKGLEWLKIYGMNSITAYVIGEVVDFRSIAYSLSFGLQRFLSEGWFEAWLTFANFSIVFLILLALYKLKIFIKF